MVISFSNDAAWGHLIWYGEVVTFRKNKRERTPDEGVQTTWCNRGRNKEKEFDVNIELIGEVDPRTDLHEWKGVSGFYYTKYWTDAIREMNGGSLPEKGWLYKVKIVDESTNLYPKL